MLCRWMKIWIWMNARVTLSFFLYSWFSTVLYLFLYYLILSIYHFKTIETIIQPLNMLLYHIVDFDRGLMFWVQPASWAKLYNLRKIGFFVYAFFKTSSFSNGSFVYFLIFIYILGGKCQSLWSFSIDAYSGKIPSKYMPKSKFKTNPCRPCNMCTVWTPLSLAIKNLWDTLAECLYLFMCSIQRFLVVNKVSIYMGNPESASFEILEKNKYCDY